MATVAVDRFVETLMQHQLLEEEQLHELIQLQAQFPTPREFAEELVHRHWLSAYQLTQISQGNAAALVLGQYILIERLGEGGMGEVFKARQRNLERIVALKVIRKECLDNPRVIQRFLREIRAAGHLSHPNIVHAYDADQIDGQHYIAMEFIDGVDLAKLVKQSGPLPVAQACNYIRQAAVGLHHAHECGLIHRDVKPHNLLVTQNAPKTRASSALLRRPAALTTKSTSSAPLSRPGLSENPWGIVKILDLGLARWNEEPGRTATNLTHLGTVMGSPDFIAPEQARNARTSDIRADLYGLGCTLYFLLAGRIPFPNGTLTEKLLQHQVDEPEPIEAVRRAEWAKYARRIGQTRVSRSVLRVPSEVAALVKMMMAKRPEDRPKTAQDVADALADIQRHLTSIKPPADNTMLEEPASAPTIAGELTATHIGEQAVILKPQTSEGKRARFGRRLLTLAMLGGVLFLGLVLAAVGGRSTNPEASQIEVKPPVQKAGKQPVH